MRLNNQNRIAQSRAIRTAIFPVLVSLFVLAGTPEALATVWNKNQNFQCGPAPSPSSIPSNYETNQSCNKQLCPGTPIHIVYGISDPAGNSNPVTVKIVLPTAFTDTKVQALKFPGGTLLTPQPTRSTLASGYTIGALASSTDHVIIVIDGYFTQASTYSVPFEPSRSDLTAKQNADEATSVNMDSTCKNPPINLSISKTASPATVALNSSVTYTLTITNTSTPQSDHSTDLYLGGLLTVTDTLSVNGNGLPLDVSVSGFTSTSTLGAALMNVFPTVPTPISFCANCGTNYPMSFQYPTGSNGYLPAGGSFSISFKALIATKATCTTGPNNNLKNSASIIFSGATISDSNGSDNSDSKTVSVTGAPTNACPTPTPAPALPVDKKLIPPTFTPAWGATFTYQIEFTNSTSAALTGVVLYDQLDGTGSPPFTATFLPGSVTCSPAACSSITPSTTTSIAGSGYPTLFSATIGSLPAGKIETVTYQVRYDAPCSDVATAGIIKNRAYLTGSVTGTSNWIPANMPTLPLCQLEVTKSPSPAPKAFSSYPETLGYRVQFKNNSTKPITVGTVVDAMAQDSALYGNVPIDYSYTCSATNATVPTTAVFPTKTGSGVVQYNASGATYGYQLLNFSGATFQGGGHIDCDVSVTLKQPLTTDSLCEGKGKKHNVTNAAYMNLLPYNYNKPPTMTPPWYHDVTTPLPDCVSILVGKTAPATVSPGGVVTFTLTVTNVGKDPISGVVLQDTVPTTLTGPFSWQCTTNCASVSPTSGTGNVLTTLTNLPAGATVTVTLQATAPTEIPAAAICNDDKATFSPPPLPPQTYFEGDQDALTHAQACIQVVPVIKGTPTPTASPRASATPSPTPSTTAGCADVSDKEIKCLPGGGYTYTFNVANNSGSAMSQILLTPLSGSKFTLTPQLTNLSAPLQNGQSTTVTTKIGNAKPGDKVCFFASLMSDKAACCTVQVCPTLPVCEKR